MLWCDVCCGDVQELVPLKQEGADSDFRLSCSLPVQGLSWLSTTSPKLLPPMLHNPRL